MMSRLLLEMRRRKVLRVAGAYTVTAWGVLQVAEVVLPALALPGWTVTFVAALLLMGLPIAMVLAWVFQVRPESESAAGESAERLAAGGGRWLDVALLGAAVTLVTLSGFQLLSRDRAALAPEAAAAGSVAVLPFASFSDDSSDSYFADGLTEELINTLAQLPGLQVTGRTSSFFFKNKNEDLRDIGRQLGVSHLLEGSVRRSGQRLRVTVQLVSAADGFHLWSRTYDRKLTDVFAIQNDIAGHVAGALKLTLLTGAGQDEPEVDRGRYPSFLVATALLRDQDPKSQSEARRLFEEILEAEPDNVEALSGYARATIVLAGAYLTIDFESAAASARQAVERALALAPDNIAANLAAGSVYDTLGWRTGEQQYLPLAERALARAVDLAPNDPEVLMYYGALLEQLGRWDAALAVTERAVQRDPLARGTRLQFARALRGAGRLGEARVELEGVLERHPDYVAARLELGELLIETGALDAAVVHLRQAHQSRTSPRATFALANVYLNLGLNDAVRRTLAELSYAPLTLPLGKLVERLAWADDADALAYAEAELTRTEDRILRPVVVLMALRTGDLGKAREQLRQLEPMLLAPEPDVSRMDPSIVLMAANLLAREGRADDSARLLEALLRRTAAPAQGFDPVGSKLVRAQALAQFGRNSAAMAELSAARLQGYRSLFDFDYFLRIDRHPAFATLRGEPEFQAWLSAIQADNRALAARLASQPPPAEAAALRG